MTGVFLAGALAVFVAALLAVVLGRNLTRSIFAALVSVAVLFVLLAGGVTAGFEAFFLIATTALSLALVQLFGWMLVDVDRDHLPPTDAPTAWARGLAFVLVGGGLSLLARGVLRETTVVTAPGTAAPTRALALGARLFAAEGGGALLLGLLLASVLLAALMLLRDAAGER